MFVSSAKYEAMQMRALAAEQQVRVLEERLHLQSSTHEAQMEAARKEREKLTDRILQMTGQPPIYEQAVIQPEQPSADLPKVRRKVSLDEIHEVARAAIADGSFNLMKRNG